MTEDKENGEAIEVALEGRVKTLTADIYLWYGIGKERPGNFGNLVGDAARHLENTIRVVNEARRRHGGDP